MSSDNRQKQKLISRSLLAGVVAHGGVAGAETHSETNSDAVVLSNAVPASRSVEFTAEESVVDIDVTVDFAKCANPGYDGDCPQGTYTGAAPDDMMFSLESPAGTMVSLIPFDAFERAVGDLGVEPIITFDDEAELVVNHDVWNVPSGTYQPLGELADFDGESIAGTWTLHFQNRDSSHSTKPLAFNSFTLEIVPEASALASALGAGAALAGLAARRRRRRDQP